MSGFTDKDVPDQSGRTVIVTGANSGIGFETARVLARRGARVLLGCRNQSRAEAAMDKIRRETPDADLVFLPLDQADLASVRNAAELATREPRIDVLLNNAGVGTPPLTRTAEGFELQFGVNHLGTFALTALLLPKLADTGGGRVVVTSSVMHRVGKLKWDDLNAHRSYNRVQRYADSKLANLLFAFELDRRLRASGSPVIAVACHPGVAATELGRHNGPTQFSRPMLSLTLNSAEKGAWPGLQAACGSDVKSGDYFGPQGILELRGPSGPAGWAGRARDSAQARRLWEESVAMTGIDPGLAPA